MTLVRAFEIVSIYQAQLFLWKIHFLIFLVILMPTFEENSGCSIALRLFVKKVLSKHKVLSNEIFYVTE